jgi:hypothetical protein
MTRNTLQKLASTGSAALAALSFMGCAANVEGVEEDGVLDVGSNVSALATTESSNPFLPNGTVAVCFNPVEGTPILDASGKATGEYSWTVVSDTDPDVAAFTAMVRREVEAVYETLSDTQIDFTGWQTCSDPQTGTFVGGIRVQVDVGTARNYAFRHCPKTAGLLPVKGECVSRAGYTATQEMQLYTSTKGYGLLSSDQRAAVLHEFGHALGFSHEFQRDDSSDDYDNKLFVCTAGAGDQGYSLDFTYYDTNSIMNATYCHWNPWLSVGDGVGLAMTYPNSFSQDAAVVPSAIWLSDGTAITLNRASVLPRWIDRGALDANVSGTATFWTVNGALKPSAASTAYLLPTDFATVEASYRDRYNRAFTIGPTTIEVDTNLYAAVLNTML